MADSIKFSITSRAITATRGMRSTEILELPGEGCVLCADLYTGVRILVVCAAPVFHGELGYVQDVWLFDMKFTFSFYNHMALLFMLGDYSERFTDFDVFHLNGGSRVPVGQLRLYSTGEIILNGSTVSSYNANRIFTKALMMRF